MPQYRFRPRLPSDSDCGTPSMYILSGIDLQQDFAVSQLNFSSNAQSSSRRGRYHRYPDEVSNVLWNYGHVGASINQAPKKYLALFSEYSESHDRSKHHPGLGLAWKGLDLVCLVIEPHLRNPTSRPGGTHSRMGSSSPAAMAASRASSRVSPLLSILSSFWFQVIHFPPYSLGTIGLGFLGVIFFLP
jgi:hypothetical protein